VPPFERTGAEDPPQLRQQRRQRRIDSPGRLVAPDCVDDLVACADLVGKVSRDDLIGMAEEA